MNQKIHFRIAILLLLMPFITLANTNAEIGKTTKERNIKKSFDVSADATLKIDNSYGNLDIVTWDQNRIEFDITIEVTGNNANKVEERLNEISVSFNNTKDLVTAKTNFENKDKNWWSWNNNKKLKIEVHYRVKMPITNNVDLDNNYGSINLDRLKGKAKIHCSYGKVTTKELMADGNYINFDYSKGCYFEFIKSGKLYADYSEFTIAKTKSLYLNTGYTNSIIENSEDVEFNCDYGSLRVDNINSLKGNADYLTLRIVNLYKSINLKADYGSLKIDRIASKANNVEIDSEFMGITISYDSNYSFDFDIDLEYASLRDSDTFNFTNKEVDSFEKKYNGYHGTKGSGNYVKIKSQYGSVSFKQQ
ncbi:hypothetical protein [Winogradskyella algicola]|uniref:hypothetical protein n=1 Tax=Winogradskyella algicola TaxID=2575815 RepID=UPI001107CCF2|nr:hypothetical protein [Winogradskyella algicola]